MTYISCSMNQKGSDDDVEDTNDENDRKCDIYSYENKISIT